MDGPDDSFPEIEFGSSPGNCDGGGSNFEIPLLLERDIVEGSPDNMSPSSSSLASLEVVSADDAASQHPVSMITMPEWRQPPKGLIVRAAWASALIQGTKSWELRGRRTKYRGRLGIISSGAVVGEVRLTACWQDLSEIFLVCLSPRMITPADSCLCPATVTSTGSWISAFYHRTNGCTPGWCRMLYNILIRCHMFTGEV